MPSGPSALARAALGALYRPLSPFHRPVRATAMSYTIKDDYRLFLAGSEVKGEANQCVPSSSSLSRPEARSHLGIVQDPRRGPVHGHDHRLLRRREPGSGRASHRSGARCVRLGRVEPAGSCRPGRSGAWVSLPVYRGSADLKIHPCRCPTSLALSRTRSRTSPSSRACRPAGASCPLAHFQSSQADVEPRRPYREMSIQLGRLHEWFEYAGALARTEEGSTQPVRGSLLNFVKRGPLGVCALISSFNHPLLISIKKLGPSCSSCFLPLLLADFRLRRSFRSRCRQLRHVTSSHELLYELEP